MTICWTNKKVKKGIDNSVQKEYYNFCRWTKQQICGCSSMVELQPSKLITWVRFPSPAWIRKDVFIRNISFFRYK